MYEIGSALACRRIVAQGALLSLSRRVNPTEYKNIRRNYSPQKTIRQGVVQLMTAHQMHAEKCPERQTKNPEEATNPECDTHLKSLCLGGRKIRH